MKDKELDAYIKQNEIMGKVRMSIPENLKPNPHMSNLHDPEPEKCTCQDKPISKCIIHSCPCGCEMSIEDKRYQAEHSAPSPDVPEEVELAEEGTPLGDFQKLRTNATSSMFDRDKNCGEIHTTSKLYAELDNGFSRLLSSAIQGEREKIKKEAMEK